MKEKIIKLLRNLEERSGFENNYTEYNAEYQCHYAIQEYVNFPNFKTITQEYNTQYPIVQPNGLAVVFPSNSILAELKRMEMEGLVMLGIQEGRKYGTTSSAEAPDFDDGFNFSTESVILTTKGKSKWQYFLYKATEENPIATILSIMAIVISIFASFSKK